MSQALWPFCCLDFGPSPGLPSPFFAMNPKYVLRLESSSLTLYRRGCVPSTIFEGLDPFIFLDSFRAQYASDLLGVGYLGYPLRRYTERAGPLKPFSVPFSELFFAFFDHFFCLEAEGPSLEPLSSEGERLGRRSLSPLLEGLDSLKGSSVRAGLNPDKVFSGTKKPSYLRGVQEILKRIRKGDVYQVNLSLELFAQNVNPEALFGAMTRSYPMPYQAFLRLDPLKSVLLNSPELFLEITPDRQILTAPIKGSMPRSKAAHLDASFADTLQASPKDRAEHLMIVDLMRNDLGRVCSIGSIRVQNLFGHRPFPGIHHLETKVSGELPKRLGLFEAIGKAFPGGSITGAPKIMAMRIIEELEPTERSVYTGALGWAFRGHVRLAMAIRTALCFEGTAMYPVGGGIVADSDPEAEWDETQTKAKPFLQALGFGGDVGLDLA